MQQRCINRPAIIASFALFICNNSLDKFANSHLARKRQNTSEIEYTDSENLELVDSIMDNLSKKLKQSNEFLISELEKLPTNKANPRLVENLILDCEKKPIKYLARTTVNQSTIKIQPYNKEHVKHLLDLVHKTFPESQTKSDSENVWITISALSDDLKEGVKAAVKELLLNTKNKHRVARQDAINALKNAKDRLSDDFYHMKLQEVDETSKKLYGEVEKLCNKKIELSA
ncbi:hypothetical protein BMR1_03g00150 [Babesia microti strain RI]|uniref:Ribosome recycling factor domain-containing protein n=1 Tax=Babesia microti (strain RI) TaxID=1133968 RepID=A0A0K3AQA5_BABMR|nr:hypothetical protein BMR1_03g00150 [Babesia microti strain RI]CTQ40630.1 hypothetical protein BMR1_03g00150 [Babesia microti strain RI]|eukprot:XP_012648641.1 hypothetical protein BMR1_03g00150 [Babesia microti strain RI]